MICLFCSPPVCSQTSRSCCRSVFLCFPPIVLSDCSQTGSDTCKWRGDGMWSKLRGNQTGPLPEFWLVVKAQLDSFKFASCHSPIQASRTCHQLFRGRTLFIFSSLCQGALEWLKPQHICTDTKPRRWNVPFHAARRKTVKCGDTKVSIIVHNTANHNQNFWLIQQFSCNAGLFFFFVVVFLFLSSNLKNFLDAFTSLKETRNQAKRSLPTHYQ